MTDIFGHAGKKLSEFQSVEIHRAVALAPLSYPNVGALIGVDALEGHIPH